MNGGIISGNANASPYINRGGGGVYVEGTFTINGGTVSENTASSDGGGVYVNGTFTMKDGVISGNTASIYGGGVYVSGTSFTMSGGSISGNTARNSGGGVFSGTLFTKSGKVGVIYGSNAESDQANRAGSDNGGHAVHVNDKKRNTTARAATAMDSTKNGPAGGWE
jgi:predicted outer membrane repeat protein